MKVDEKENGYDGRVFVGNWQEYEVFDPIYNDNEVRYTGYPEFILVDKDGNERWTRSIKEAFAIIHFFDQKEKEGKIFDNQPEVE